MAEDGRCTFPAMAAQCAERDMIQSDPKQGRDVRENSEASHAEQLALLYQGILTAIVRIQSGKQQIIDANAFQKRMESLLDEIKREAIKVGYRNQDIEDAHYATIAFLDETVQRSNDPNRGQWTPLQAKRYAQAVAGEGVFEQLKTIRTRRDSRELADLLEVYDLCFLLGYQGRYAVGGRSELDRLIEDLREQIERIRGHQALLSPEGNLPSAAQASVPLGASAGKWKTIAIGCAAVAFLGWIALKLILVSHAQGAISEMLAG
jgi:type VI secretion system protein ImpK